MKLITVLLFFILSTQAYSLSCEQIYNNILIQSSTDNGEVHVRDEIINRASNQVIAEFSGLGSVRLFAIKLKLNDKIQSEINGFGCYNQRSVETITDEIWNESAIEAIIDIVDKLKRNNTQVLK